MIFNTSIKSIKLSSTFRLRLIYKIFILVFSIFSFDLFIVNNFSLAQGTKSYLVITSNVPAAKVFIDGILSGSVGDRHPISHAGSKIITVSSSGYESYRTRINVEYGKEYRLNARLKKAKTQEEKRQEYREKRLVEVIKAREKVALEQQIRNQEQALNQDIKNLNAPVAQPVTAPVPSYGTTYPQPQSAYNNPNQNSGYYNQPKQGNYQNQPKRKRRKKRRKRARQSKKPNNQILTPPAAERSGLDYALSFLPLGIAQFRHDRPALGFLFLLLQAGGGGAAGYFYWTQSSVEVESAEDVKKIKQSTKDSQEVKRKKINNILQQWDDYYDHQRLLMFISIGIAASGYALSAALALALGPKPKKPNPFESLLQSNLDNYQRPYHNNAMNNLKMVYGSDAVMANNLLRSSSAECNNSLSIDYIYCSTLNLYNKGSINLLYNHIGFLDQYQNYLDQTRTSFFDSIYLDFVPGNNINNYQLSQYDDRFDADNYTLFNNLSLVITKSF